MKLVKKQKVGASMTDYAVNLSAIGMFQIVEDTITELMGDMHIDGMTAKREYNAVWVLTKNRIKFYKPIAWNQEFTVTGFISRKSLATLHIDVEIQNAQGERAAYARVEICALDLQTGRIRKVSTVGVDEHIQVEQACDNVEFAKFGNTELTACEEVRIRSSHIDYAQHANNKEYVRFIVNTYSVDELQARPIREMEVDYLQQTFENDVLTVCKGSVDNKDVVTLQKGDTPVVKSEIVF